MRRELNRPLERLFRDLESNIGDRAGWMTDKRRADALPILLAARNNRRGSEQEGQSGGERAAKPGNACGCASRPQFSGQSSAIDDDRRRHRPHGVPVLRGRSMQARSRPAARPRRRYHRGRLSPEPRRRQDDSVPRDELNQGARPLTVLVIHAHPDDEVFATGAATLAAKAAGHHVVLRVLTGGEGRSADRSAHGLSRARQRRADLLDHSASLLGIDSWAPVDEGRWADTPHAPELTLAAAPLDDLTTAIVTTIEAVKPSAVLTVGREGLTGHPDHIACHRAVVAAVGRLAEPGLVCLGAVLNAKDVTTARHTSRQLTGVEVGTGRTAGSDTSHSIRLNGPPNTEARRRAAVDVYAPGLGTFDIGGLMKTADPGSDSLLMRLVLDYRGWDFDLVDTIAGDAGPASPWGARSGAPIRTQASPATAPN